MPLQTPSRSKPIDGLRGICILYILCIHLRDLMPGANGSLGLEYLHVLSRASVETFFCISGYIVFGSMWFRHKNGNASFKNFFVRRFLRIYPLWSLAVLGYWIIFHLPLNVVIALLTFTFGFFRFDHAFDTVLITWSLFCEEWFYLILPVFFMFIKNWQRAALVAIAFGWVSHYWILLAPSVGVPTSSYFVELFPLATFYYFFLGIFIFLLQQSEVYKRALSFLSKFKIATFSFDLVTIFILITALGPMNESYMGGHALPIFALMLTAMIPGTVINSILHFLPLRKFGANCYSLYLFHPIVYALLYTGWRKWLQITGLFQANKEMQTFVCIPIAVGILFLMSEAIEKWIERPLLKKANETTYGVLP